LSSSEDQDGKLSSVSKPPTGSDGKSPGDEADLAVESDIDWGVELDYKKRNGKNASSGGDLRAERRADRLMTALRKEIDLFRTPDGEAFATVKMRAGVEHLPLESAAFGHWLRRWAQERGEALLGKTEVEKLAINLAALALGMPEVHVIAYRVGRAGDRLYVDLGDDARRVVEIFPARPDTTERWRVIPGAVCPIRFVRPPTMRALPVPTEGGTVDDFRRHFNVATEGDFKLLMCWLVAAYHPTGPFLLGLVHGQQGSGKTTLCRLLVSLTDPQLADIRALPENPRDLAVAAQYARTLAFDNASMISASMSDCLCRLSTGDAIVCRTLHSNKEQTVLRASRPVLISSIVGLARRPDLADRAVVIEARALDQAARRTEQELWWDFETEKPMLFGTICDLLSAALGNYASTKAPAGIRMADSARWAIGGLQFANWNADELGNIWRANRHAADIALLESDVVASALLEFLEQRPGGWEGRTGELLAQLTEQVNHRVRSSKAWPHTPEKLASDLTRLKPALESKGWLFSREKGAGGSRSITFQRTVISAAE
jgi:hypothetical protein